MAFLWAIVLLMILPVDASEPCQHEECQDRSVLLQHAVKKHEHNTSRHQLSGHPYQLGSFGCSNYASAELKLTWTKYGYQKSGQGSSCLEECASTTGCVGFAYLTNDDTTCKSASQSIGSCTLWKKACTPDYTSGCEAWNQYSMGTPSPAPAPPPASGFDGHFGCQNYASSELKVTWTESDSSCESECKHTTGCVGFAWLTTSDTTCKSSSQSRGSCTLWKESCARDYFGGCEAWAQYTTVTPQYLHGHWR